MHVGPVVADDEAIGLALLSSAMAATEQRVILDVPDRHQAVAAWLAAQGRHGAAHLHAHAARELSPPCEDAASIFALAGPELA